LTAASLMGRNLLIRILLALRQALLECLSSVAQAMGDGFMDYAEPVFGRCLSLIEQNIAAAGGDDLAEAPDKEFIVVALDLLSSLAEGLEGAIESLVAPSNMFQLLCVEPTCHATTAAA